MQKPNYDNLTPNEKAAFLAGMQYGADRVGSEISDNALHYFDAAYKLVENEIEESQAELNKEQR
jgi:hypothetical protein